MEYLFLVVCLTAAMMDLIWRRIANIWLWSWFLTGLLLAGLGEIPILGTEVSHTASFLFRGMENVILLPSEKISEYVWQISGTVIDSVYTFASALEPSDDWGGRYEALQHYGRGYGASGICRMHSFQFIFRKCFIYVLYGLYAEFFEADDLFSGLVQAVYFL